MSDASVAQWMEGWRAGMEQAARAVQAEAAREKEQNHASRARRLFALASEIRAASRTEEARPERKALPVRAPNPLTGQALTDALRRLSPRPFMEDYEPAASRTEETPAVPGSDSGVAGGNGGTTP